MSDRLEEIAEALEVGPADQPVACADVTLPRGFELDAQGLWHRPPDRDGEAQPRMWLCGPFQVLGLARDGAGEGWGVVIEFPDPDRRLKREIIGRDELAGDGAEVRKRLLSRGLVINPSPKARSPLQVALLGLTTPSRVRLEASTGWHGDVYVLPHRTVGAGPQEPVLYQGRGAASYHAEAGSYIAWKAKIAAPMVGNAAGVFVIAAALAAPLLRELGGEGGGFHLRGFSSKGKSTLQRVAGSVWGGGGRLGYSQSWRHTDNAIDAAALAHNDCLLCLDEIKQLGPEAAGQIAYTLAAGVQKGRLRADGTARDRATWCVLILSSGEMGLADLARSGRNPRERSYTGQELRLQDLAVDFHPEQGVWERLPDGGFGEAAAAAFSKALGDLTSAHYGWAGPDFVGRYLKDRACNRARASELRIAFLAHVLRDDDTGQVRRGAERFAVVAAAGELAAELGVLPWPKGEALAGAARVFERWAVSFGRTQQREDRDALIKVRDYLQRTQHAAFRVRKGGSATEDEMYDQAKGVRPREGEARSLVAAGWRDDEGDESAFHIFPSAWADLFAGSDPIAAARALDRAGYLICNPGRLQNRVSIGGRKESFYSVSARILGHDEFTVPGEAEPPPAEVRTAKGVQGQSDSAAVHTVHTVRSTFDEDAEYERQERAAILEHEAGLSRCEAERVANSPSAPDVR